VPRPGIHRRKDTTEARQASLLLVMPPRTDRSEHQRGQETMTYPDNIKSASDEQIHGWRASSLGLSLNPRWSDYVVAELILRIDEYRHKVLRLIQERDTYRYTADEKVYVRRELEELLGTEDIGEAVALIKAWKGAAMMQAGQVQA
jgi:hypothetical protein